MRVPFSVHYCSFAVHRRGKSATSAAFLWATTAVGYQQTSIVKGYSFFTAVFESLTAENFNLSDIACRQYNGAEWKTSGSGTTKCAGAVTVRKIDTEGSYGVEYAYYSTKPTVGWYNGDTLVENDAVTFAPGEGMIVYCGNANGAVLQTSGSVRLASADIVVPKGYSFSGNSSPIVINLSSIACKQYNGSEWKSSGSGTTKCAGAVTVRKIDSEGSYGTEYAYYSTKATAGWYNGDTLIEGDAVTFAPGEGFIVYCGNANGAQVVLPATL